MDNSVWNFGGLPPILSAWVKRKASIWHTRWLILWHQRKKKVWKTERQVPTDTNSLLFKLCYKHFFLYRRLMLLCIKKKFYKWTLEERSRLNSNVFFFVENWIPNHLRSFTSSNSVLFPSFWLRHHSVGVSFWFKTWQVECTLCSWLILMLV